MALDLGELVARVSVEGIDRAEQGLTGFERNLLRVARTQVPDITVDVATGVAEGALAELEALLRGLPDGAADAEVDTASAERRLEQLRSELRGVPDADVDVDVDVDRQGLDDLERDAGAAGDAAGDAAGEGLSDGILAALTTIPVAGAAIAIGALVGKSLLDGLENEVREDTLVATTGLDPADAARIGLAAGEAYAGNFGDSISTNFDTARAAIQAGLLDPASTSRDSQQIIQSLSGVADILGEDIPRVARATATLLRTGLVDEAGQAFDIFVKGQQNGANAAEDLLDTFSEYPAVLQRLGLNGEEALGLISQGLQAGARDSDLVADALKEFQILATDGSEASAAAFKALGLDAEDATARIAAGGEGARAGLDEVLDGLRAIEDPVKRNAAAVGLFGATAEDLGTALFALDLDTVYDDLTDLEGAASGAISALGDNSAGQLASAQRNIEIAADGIKGALAEAFGPQIEEFASTVTGNRAAVVGFLLDVGNGAFDAGRSLVEAAAAGTEAFGDFVGSAGPQVLDLIAAILEGIDSIPFIDLGDARMEFDVMRTAAEDSFKSFDEGSSIAAEALRTNLIDNGIDPAQRRLNEVGFDLETQARFTDSTTALAGAVADIGYAADDTQLAVDRTGAAFDTTTEAGRLLDEQIRTAVEALDAQTRAGEAAGRTTEELTADYTDNREALLDQLEAMGFTRDEAKQLADAYGAIPNKVVTDIEANTADAAAALEDIRLRIANIQSKNVRISVDRIESIVRQEQAQANRGGTQPVDRRANGGPVARGVDYLVGEEGPELIVAPTDGFVIPAGPTAAILAGGYGAPTPLAPQALAAGAGGANVHVQVYEATSARRTAEETIKQVRLELASARL